MNPQLVKRVLDLAVEIQQIPAPTFDESQRAEFMRNRFLLEELDFVKIDKVGNVQACLTGLGGSQPIVVSAHLDTVFPPETYLEVELVEDKIAGPGIGDNAVGVAGLLGLVWAIKQTSQQLDSDLWLVANVGEEGLGDLRGMRALVDQFGDQPKAYLILEGMALGQVYHRGLGVHRCRITVKTSGGHSWVNYGKPSAVHEIADIIVRLLAIQLPDQPRTTINVGVISGGTSVNTIAAEANLVLDLRSQDAAALSELVKEVEDVARDKQNQDVTVIVETIGERPVGAISPDHPLVKLAVNGLGAVGVQPRLNIGSTDANIPLSRGFPAICLGLTTGDGAHTIDEYIHTAPLEQGLKQLFYVVDGLDRS
jgi:acetylornithine deacetylase/succinyl-diaminopimelate desuccinylase-like protein